MRLQPGTFEGYTNTYGYVSNASNVAIIRSNASAIDNISKDYDKARAKVASDTKTIVQNIAAYNEQNRAMPDEIDIPGYGEKDKTTADIILEDTDQMLLQQNNVYLFGSIAAATLLISAIMISSQ